MLPEGVKRKRRPLVTCAVIVFAIILFLIAAALWIVASTGVVMLPAFSRLAYDVPQPVRVVSPGVPVETYVQTVVSEEIVKRLYSGQGVLADETMSITLPENALTATLQSMGDVVGMDLFDIEESQVALDETIGAELFFPFKNSEQQTAVRLHMMAVAEDGVVTIEVRDVWVGSLHVPMWLVGVAADAYLKNGLVELNEQMGQYVRINEIEYDNGSMTLSGDLAVDLLDFGG